MSTDPQNPAPAPAPNPAAGMDEYQKLMAAREAGAKRNRMIFGAVAVAVIGVVAFKMQQQRKAQAEAQVKLDYFGRFAETDKRETGSFWNCVLASEVDVGMFNSTDQIQQRVEGAYFTQQKTFSDHLTTECVPKIERAITATGSISDAPAEYTEALTKYKAALPKMKSGIESYAEKIKTRGAVKDVDKLIQETGTAMTTSPDPSPESVAFEKFMICAIPDLGKLKDQQAVLEFLADTCYKKDVVAFMTRVRDECGPMVTGVDKDAKPAPSKTFKANLKRIAPDGDDRILQAWESCGKKSRKGKKVEDLEEFLVASGDYIESRGLMAQTAKEIERKAKGEEKKEEAPAAPGAVPPAGKKKH